jgi:hypothetical protein
MLKGLTRPATRAWKSARMLLHVLELIRLSLIHGIVATPSVVPEENDWDCPSRADDVAAAG